MIFCSKLLSRFQCQQSTQVRDRQTQTSSGSVENTQLRFGSPRRDPFFDPSPPFFEFRPILWELLD